MTAHCADIALSPVDRCSTLDQPAGSFGDGFAIWNDPRVSQPDDLERVLRSVIAHVERSDVDAAAWRSQNSSAHLLVDLTASLRQDEVGDLSNADARRLEVMFAPTGILQEVSMANGWADEFVSLSTRFDEALRR